MTPVNEPSVKSPKYGRLIRWRLAFGIIVVSLAIIMNGKAGSGAFAAAPTATPTPLTTGLRKITPGNAARVSEIAVLGRGNLASVAWSRDGKTIAAGGATGIWLYSANDLGASPRQLKASPIEVWSIAFSPDGKLLASGDGDGKVRLWDPRGGLLRSTLSGHSGMV
jgi:WD40 repeat protein